MGRRTSFPEIPVFENYFLKAIANALAKRRKSLSYWCERIELTSSTDLIGKVPFERLDLTLRFGQSGSERVHLAAWEDSRAWVWAGKYKKNVAWTFEIELHTDLWNVEPADIVQRVEATKLLIPDGDQSADDEEQARFQKLWSPVARPIGRRKRKRR